jgi:CO dehydrogenase/acetyl-CoA synthase beta subunit
VSIFDAYVNKVHEYVEEMEEKGNSPRVYRSPTTVSELIEDLPIRVGAGASPGIILRGDTYVELGSPDAGSCALLLWTDNPSLVSDGRITLIGPDIGESGGASLSFAQVVLVGGAELSEQEHSALDQSQYVADRIEGYMIKSTPERMWSRVGRDVAEKGFDFSALGKALMVILKSEVTKVQAVEILFVTSGKDDVQRLDEIATQVRSISKNIVRENWLARGYDVLECSFGWDCSTCTDKAVCDEIRQVISVRKKKGRDSGTKPVE